MPKISDLNIMDEPFHSIFSGVGGSGKSTAAASFPRPFILDFDHGVRVLSGLEWAKDVEYEHIDNIPQLTRVLAMLDKRDDIDTVVFDSGTVLINIALQYFCELNGHWDAEKHMPGPKAGMLEFGQRIGWLENMLIQLLAQKKHNTIFITHEAITRNDATGAIVKRSPYVPGVKLPDHIEGLCDDLFRFSINPGSPPSVKVMTVGTPSIVAKSRHKHILKLPDSFKLEWGDSFYDKLMGFREGDK